MRLLFTLLLTACYDVSHSLTASPKVGPVHDPFYALPANLSSFSDGQMIRQRPITTSIEGSFSSLQVLYKSPTAHMDADATVVTIWTPPTPAYPAKLLSYQASPDSASHSCAPSWAFVKGTASRNVNITVLDTPIFIQWALAQGYFVVSADHSGSHAAFSAGKQEGMAVLNGIRAAKEVITLPASTAVVLYGYGGGAHATAWADSIAHVYAPELNIVGSAMGGTHLDPRSDFRHLNKGPLAGFLGASLVGLANAHPHFDLYLNGHATAQGKELLVKYRSEDFCVAAVAASAPAVDFLSLYALRPFINESGTMEVSRVESLLASVNPGATAVPSYPRLLLHAEHDERAPFAAVEEYVKEQCSRGADIQFVTMHSGGHITAALYPIPGVLLWIRSALERSTKRIKCGTADQSFQYITSPGAASVAGEHTIKMLLALNGTQVGTGSKVHYGS